VEYARRVRSEHSSAEVVSVEITMRACLQMYEGHIDWLAGRDPMGIETQGVTGRPWPLRDLEAALAFVNAEMVVNSGRMGPKDTGPAVMHYMGIRDALKALIALAK
jgi:hypothetical protein